MLFLTQGKTNWKYILIVLILAVIVGGGILGWIKMQEVPPVKFPEIKKPEKVVEDETANWKTYRNEKFGFEMRYPRDWYFEEEIEIPPPPPPEKPKLLVTFRDFPGEHPEEGKGRFVFVEIGKDSVNGWLHEQKEAGAEIEEITIGLAKGYKAIIPSYGYAHIQVVVVKNKYLYKLVALLVGPDISAEKVFFNQILSTFRFLE